MNLILLPSRFYTRPRPKPLRFIVLHTTEGTDSRTWLTETGGVSAHYLARTEAMYFLVNEGDAAWHAGKIVGTPTTPLYLGGNPNDESIGIEMEGFAAGAVDPRIIRATSDLVTDIRRRHGPLPIVNHSELSPGSRSDPGAQNRAAVEAALEEDTMTPEDRAKLDRLIAIGETLLAHELSNDELVWTARVQRSLDVERGTVFDAALPPIDPRIRP